MSGAREEAFMRRAIDLARGAAGTTAANPPVGCVIVAEGEVVGEAATAKSGRPHAEEQALAMAGIKARGATAYVTMEPCGARSSGARSCAEALANAGVARVVYAASNPDHLSAGRGPRKLRAGGVAVESGVLAAETHALYAGFIAAVRGRM
jgi:diaminohydroxyphosphoribosylaminopyrimidine deaminase/5-amino-6-(5-phosphoribosylamino)uracil reductase